MQKTSPGISRSWGSNSQKSPDQCLIGSSPVWYHWQKWAPHWLTSLLYIAGFAGFSIDAILYVWNVVFVNGIILSLSLLFIISYQRGNGIQVVHLICFNSFLHHRGSPQRGFTFQPLSSSHFSSLLWFPPLRAEEPQCLLLTFSYHLSPFHHHHYLPSALCHLPPAPRLSPRLSPPRAPFVCFSLISILPLLQTAGRFSAPDSPSCFPIPIHHSIVCSLLQRDSCCASQLWSFDLHEITALLESILWQSMKPLSLKLRLWK